MYSFNGEKDLLTGTDLSILVSSGQAAIKLLSETPLPTITRIIRK